MKIYKFTVEIEDYTTGSSFIDGIKSEIQSEKAQLELTHKINEAASVVLKQVLEDFLKPINEELKKVGLEFEDDPYMGAGGTNRCRDHYFKMKLPNTHWSYVIGIFGIPHRGFPHSKYTTFTGDFKIMLGLNDSTGYTACQKDKLSVVKDVDDVFRTIRDRVKAEILEQ